MTRECTIDAGGLEITFSSDPLRVWVRVERQVGVWAGQEMRPSPAGGWRLGGDVVWTDGRGEPISVSARIRSRPGISRHLGQIGPSIAAAREIGPSWLVDALDGVDFAPRQNGGRERGSIASPYNETRAQKRADMRGGAFTPTPFPALEAMLPLSADEQLKELQEAGLSADEQTDWVAMHSSFGPLTPAHRRIYRRDRRLLARVAVLRSQVVGGKRWKLALCDELKRAGDNVSVTEIDDLVRDARIAGFLTFDGQATDSARVVFGRPSQAG